MKNLDVLEQEKMQIIQKMNEAVKADDPEAFQGAFVELCDQIQKNVLQQVENMVDATDTKVLSDRGVRQLTSKETVYYQKVIEAMKSKDPKQALNNLDVVMPETIIDSVFEELKTNHPLLSKIQFRSISGLTRIMMNTNGYQKAAWGKLCEEIVKELTSGFKEVDVTPNKLSAFLPVCKAMLDLGPQWLDRYVREVLYEAFANGLEDGIINGTGKDMPIGMTRQVGDDVTVVGGVYPEKKPMEITKFDDIQLGKAASILSINDKGQSRGVDTLVLLVNPSDYFAKVLSAIRRPAPGGGYVSTLPFEVDVIPCPAVAVNRAVFGMAKLYFLGAGLEESGRILYSDEYRFLEDERVYLIKGYANGFATDNNAFLLFDITNLKPSYYRVETVSEDDGADNANLSDIKIGGLALTPDFDAATTEYTVSTTDASNAVTAIPEKATATMEITHNNTVIQNGARVTWASGANVIKVKVTDGVLSETYQVTVTKNE